MAKPAYVGVKDLTTAIMERSVDHDYIPFGAACPHHSLFPNKKLARLLGSVARRDPTLISRESMNWGYEPLTREISRRYLQGGVPLAHDELVVTIGCSEALNLCLRAVTKPGDTVAIETPAYFGFLEMIESLNLRALEIPTSSREGRRGCVSAAPVWLPGSGSRETVRKAARLRYPFMMVFAPLSFTTPATMRERCAMRQLFPTGDSFGHSLRAADSESSEWQSSQSALTTGAFRLWRWPMKCHRNCGPYRSCLAWRSCARFSPTTSTPASASRPSSSTATYFVATTTVTSGPTSSLMRAYRSRSSSIDVGNDSLASGLRVIAAV